MSKEVSTHQLPLQSEQDPMRSTEKTDFDEVEHVKPGTAGVADVSALELESKFAGLNRKQTIRTFWKVILYACMVGLGALFDGYAIVGKCLAKFLSETVQLTFVQYPDRSSPMPASLKPLVPKSMQRGLLSSTRKL